MLTSGTVSSAALSMSSMAGGARLLLAAGIAGLVGWAIWLALDEPLTPIGRAGVALAMAVAALGLARAAMAWGPRQRFRAHARSARTTSERMSSFHAVMSDTNRLILRRPEPAGLFAEVCKVCVAAGHTEIAVIDLVDGDESTQVAATFSGPRAADMANVPSEIQDAQGLRRHLMQLALESRGPVVINDACNDARLSLWQDTCQQCGVNALAAIQLKRGGAPVGILLLCSSTPAFFVECLVPLLAEMGADLSFALDNSDREHARRGALEQTVLMHRSAKSSAGALVVDHAWERRAPVPADSQVLDQTWSWLNALPRRVQPVHLTTEFPRIANDMAALWRETAALDRYLEDKEFSPRAGRTGFTPVIKEELLTVHLYSMYSRLTARSPSAPLSH